MKDRRHPAGVCPALTRRLIDDALPLLSSQAVGMAHTTEIFVVFRKRGYGRIREGIGRVTVPAFVFKPAVNFCGKGLIEGGVKFAAYYLAHELAHVKANTSGHGAVFMEAFRMLCPEHLQYYELIYKPRSAARAGIARKPN